MLSAATLIPIVLRVSIALVVFALGLRVGPRDITYLLRHPGLLVRSLLSMNLVMPLLAAVLPASTDLHPAVTVTLVVLSVSPIPPVLPMKELRAGGSSSYTFSLLAIEAVLAILLAPMSILIFNWALFGRRAYVSPFAIALVVLVTVLAPLGAGIAVRGVARQIAESIAKPLLVAAIFMIAASVIPILFIATPAIVSLIGNGTLAAIIAFSIAGLAAGHLLGGPAPENRTVLALSTASRHPGVALAIAGACFPSEKLVLAALLLYLVVNAAVSIPYLIWRRRHIKSPEK